jgi:hypothetical protein
MLQCLLSFPLLFPQFPSNTYPMGSAVPSPIFDLLLSRILVPWTE